MTQGISASLNYALARMSYIEQSFSALERMSGEVSNSTAIESDFKKILDNKAPKAIEETKEIKNVEAKAPISKEIESEKVEAVELKSKIDLKAQSTNVDEIVEVYAQKYGVDSDLIKAIIKQESNFNPNATSKKGAMGLMQLMPKTAEAHGVLDAYNPSQNIEGGVKYFKSLMDKYENNQELALAAYNAGSNAVKKYGGIPPYKETQNYVNAIMGTYNKVKEAGLLW